MQQGATLFLSYWDPVGANWSFFCTFFWLLALNDPFNEDSPGTAVWPGNSRTQKILMTLLLAFWSYVRLALWEKSVGRGIRLSTDRRKQMCSTLMDESSLMLPGYLWRPSQYFLCIDDLVWRW
jgi:hypothetical protein